MARCSYLVEYQRTTPGPTAVVVEYRTTCSCIPRVADFFGVKANQFVTDVADKIDRAAYNRSYTKADGTKGTLSVLVGKIVYAAYGKANAKTVIVKTGPNTTTSKRQTLTFTFPSFLNIAEIGDALSDLIPPAKVASTGVATPEQIEPFFTIVGGRTYPLPASTTATTTPFPDLVKTPLEETALLSRTKSRTRRRTSAGPAGS